MTRSLQFILRISIMSLWCATAIATIAPSIPINIKSDTANFNNKTGVATYSGNVSVKQGTRNLYARKLTIHRDANNKIKYMIATGNPATFDSNTDPIKPGSGKAKIIKYYPQTDTIELLQDASLTQNGDTISGPKLTYNFVSEVLKSGGNETQRTTVILQSKRVP